ncbi:bifunctional diaminohydroxyphosphoribosylaminopyrimidine deaminase/5-amino-6-(5-phosphoribosylamino)uracil reductase RibD [Prochlorococcus marinus XMU1408]|uniref:Riboflavin biosynthesis protein RibD n=2 Tax=Prochlorococcus marinus TaxID=1219 RepID=A0A318R223_PROMR|nr:riboflavin biosynthesis protein RibD [Prochlorococcus marinus str. XMU1408]PYE01439.1 bifunctional diaminohydroxyphosphoribosylaminopyrimidine deaminase/5-amino-6-(5-phosphoribosylamino)uracil reductase RibD [Prochlorococcus marinus XMU1408]
MRRSIQLALLAEGRTSPNPLVGAVVLDANGKLVGEGFHSGAGKAHAEIEALAQAKDKSIDGTIVVTLEPCCHHGLTPPCTEAILKSGLKRVVIGMVDPDPRVSGNGISRLKDSGLEVIEGVLRKECEWINREFIFRILNGRPWGILKWAMSLDGRIGLPNGCSKWITSEYARENVHQIRAKCDAVIIGGGTLRADNPLLTSRGLSSFEPLRVVFSRSLDLPKTARLWDTKLAKTIIAYGPEGNEAFFDDLPDGPDKLPLILSEPSELLSALGKRGCNKILWECGPLLATRAIEMNCVQELVVFIAPKLLGGKSAMTPLNSFGFESIKSSYKLQHSFLDRKMEDLCWRLFF